MAKSGFELDTTIRKVFGEGQAMAFSRPPTLRDRVLEWTLPALWLLVAIVITAVFIWL